MKENGYLTAIKNLVLSSLQEESVKVFVFGSRARGDNHISSDVDIGIIPKGKFNSNKITLLREKIEHLNVPYKVEIVDFSEVSDDFRQESLKEVVVWKD
jgi:predicted nucleotidyltransferase